MMGRMLKSRKGALVAATFLISGPAAAHNYSELAPLDPELRSFLITLLEDAGAVDRFDGDPQVVAAAGANVSARLTAVIDSADKLDLNWLGAADYEALKHPELGRVPTGFVLQLFIDLADDIAHAEDHDVSERSETMRRDLARLETLSNRIWGQ
jgi:hypothetical protein